MKFAILDVITVGIFLGMGFSWKMSRIKAAGARLQGAVAISTAVLTLVTVIGVSLVGCTETVQQWVALSVSLAGLILFISIGAATNEKASRFWSINACECLSALEASSVLDEAAISSSLFDRRSSSDTEADCAKQYVCSSSNPRVVACAFHLIGVHDPSGRELAEAATPFLAKELAWGASAVAANEALLPQTLPVEFCVRYSERVRMMGIRRVFEPQAVNRLIARCAHQT